MELNQELIKHVAKTARLSLSKKEINEFLPQLKEILDAFSEISEVDTKNVDPSYQPVELKNITRKDIPKECLEQEDAFKNTKHKKEGYFKGPRVI
jgi:aspartyl-tRNA(Asn)/glutamyl-tRNA(Gln) amidotransferase subunit C